MDKLVRGKGPECSSKLFVYFIFFSIELGIWQSLYFILFFIFDDDFIRWQRVIVQRIKEHMVLLKNIYDFLEGLNNIFISVA